MTEQEEAYVHFVDCMECLDRAWTLLKSVGGADPKSPLMSAAHELALIEYAKPFKASEGEHSRRYKWPEPKLPEKDMELHNKIIRLRDKVLAHSDLTVKEAQLYVSQSEGKPIMTVISNIREQLPPVDEVVALIEHLLRDAYEELQRRDYELAMTPEQAR